MCIHLLAIIQFWTGQLVWTYIGWNSFNIAHVDPCRRNIENNYVKALLSLQLHRLTEWSSQISAGAKRLMMAQKETDPDVLQRQRTKGAKGWEIEGEGPCQTRYSKLLVKDQPLYSRKVRKRTLRGERNEVATDERQTGSGKLRGERLKITADKDQPARKVSSWNPRWNNITAEKHQPTQMVGSWNPRGERIEIRVLKYKVQRTTPYAATTPTVSTVFHSKSRCHANMATLDTTTCSTCSSWLSFTQA